MSLLPSFGTVKILEMINMCSNGVKYGKNSEFSHNYKIHFFTMIHFLVLVAMLCTLLYDNNYSISACIVTPYTLNLFGGKDAI